MPIYLLESSKKELDFSLVTSFIRAGAEGKISLYSYDERDRINEIIAAISKNLYMRRRADEIASRHKILSFETAPQNNNGEIIAAMRNFKLVRAVEADDAEDILNSSEIPEIRFDDVIGAREAKESLAYFVKYFKNPKEFIAKGLSLPKGILLHGKPGTGKTMLAKAMAGESGAQAAQAPNMRKLYSTHFLPRWTVLLPPRVCLAAFLVWSKFLWEIHLHSLFFIPFSMRKLPRV